VKRRLNFLALVLLGFLSIAEWFYSFGLHDDAKFILDVLTAFSVIVAILMALFGDALRQHFDPIRLSIGIPEVTNNFLDNPVLKGKPTAVYCHHLMVKNHSPHRVIESCRVWLVAILDQDPNGEFGGKGKVQFAVPRLMEWAPKEYSKDKRSFSDSQVFDFGEFFPECGLFKLRILEEQGGYFTPDCRPGNKRRYVFHVTADNYVRSDRFTVEVKSNFHKPEFDWPYPFKSEVKVVSHEH